MKSPDEHYNSDIPSLLGEAECENLEFKEAKNGFSFEKLREYCVAFANEGGGVLVFGISDEYPREITGSNAFLDIRAKINNLTSQFGLRMEAKEDQVGGKRVLRIKIPSRQIGVPLQVDGRYLMRSGESVVPMTADQIRNITNEVESDLSAQVCRGATLQDLESVAIARFRELWQRRSNNLFVATAEVKQLLRDAELMIDDGLTNAALLLFGTKSAMGRLLPQAEVVFEFRSNEESIRYQQRVEFREGFLAFENRLWEAINLRNDIQQVQDGFFIQEVPTFNEAVVREAILNAVSHRDYRHQGSIFIRQYGRKLVFTSPGSFPPGINSQNLLYKQFPRNRRLAEALQKCGLIERSGQGVDTIFRSSLTEGKGLPDYSSSDSNEVTLKIDGRVHDPKFVHFLRTISQETNFEVSTVDTIVLDEVNRGIPISSDLKDRLIKLIEVGVVERYGKGRGTRYVLSRRFYSSIGRPGAYTHKRGLDRSTRKALLLDHIQRSGQRGARFSELQDVLPSSSRAEIKSLLSTLKAENQIDVVGRTNAARWIQANLASKNQFEAN